MSIGNLTALSDKARYWWSVLYPENMIPDWKEQIDDVLQLPYAYCVHDKDLLKDGDESRKIHVHMIVAFPNTTTYKNALSVFQRFSFGNQCCNKVEKIIDIKHCYDYLIHDTEKCKKSGKYQYSRNERICGNNFDIGSYEQLSQGLIEETIEQLRQAILDNAMETFVDIDIWAHKQEDRRFAIVCRNHRGYFVELCKGIYHKRERAEQLQLNSAEKRKEKIQHDKEFREQIRDELIAEYCDPEGLKEKISAKSV